MFVSVRVPTDRDLAIDVLPSLELGPLEPDAAAKLMASIIDGVVDERARRRVMNDAQGNPLAIVELTRELTLRAADAALLPRPLSLDRRLEARFLRQIHELPPATQRLLLTAASDERSAEIYYQEALTLLGESAGDYHRARAQLVYGEWLRRQKRRRDAREQLRSAVATFEQEGAIGFADRARGELIATGERARKRVDET